MTELADRALIYAEELAGALSADSIKAKEDAISHAAAFLLEVAMAESGKYTEIVQMIWTYDRFGATAVTGIGRYFIEDMGTSNPERRYCLQHDETLGNFASMEEAQAYGQKDFERRIRACLV